MNSNRKTNFCFFQNPLRNYVYNVSLSNLLENQSERIEWHSSDAHRELCALKGKQDMDCQNYIRVYARLPDNRITICGTNSYKPLCRIYAKHIDETSGRTTTEMVTELEAQGRCPYNPTHNSTYVYTGMFDDDGFFVSFIRIQWMSSVSNDDKVATYNHFMIYTNSQCSQSTTRFNDVSISKLKKE